MYISFKNLELPESYLPDPMNVSRLVEDIAHVKNKFGGFKKLKGVDFIEHEHYHEWKFHDYILPKEIVVKHDGIPILAKVLDIKNPNKYLVKEYTIVVGGGNYIAKVYIDNKDHPHATSEGKYCFPRIVGEGPFSSFRFEKLRVSFFRWNLTNCYLDHLPQERDFEITPIFQDGG